MSQTALKSFSLENNILEISPQDEIYRFNPDQDKRINQEAPWKNDIDQDGAFYYDIKIMGLMQGKVVGDSIVVMDSFALPVQGTETRVNAASEAYEYMVEYLENSKKVGRPENAIGWYHSHPGYGCWLSGIDVNTQLNNQSYQDPFVAVVVDPNRTISAGKVDIGAFRTYPENYTPANASSSEYQSIPLNKIEDFGVHANQYYQLNVEIFKSSLDNDILAMLWNKYWVNTLSQSPLISNRAYAVSQLSDLHQKLSRAQTNHSKDKDEKKKEENQLEKSAKDSTKIAIEAQHGLIAQIIKDVIFSIRPRSSVAPNISQISDVTDMAIG
ncbi:JAB1/Mov34/MPN/PAD-1 ubiquitin protease-domain-containing protein [Amanita rubescens]|nr:JAB1/Mov34/MPN/PAD-1 ubiquitin protease-domain-containing protein [Amanita rubescens]